MKSYIDHVNERARGANRENKSMDSLQATDDASAAVQKTPNRISLDSIKDKIAAQYSSTLDKMLGKDVPLMAGMEAMTICVLVMDNGFIVIGKASPADPLNFNAELGRKLAFDDAVRQIWPLEAYQLKTRMSIEPDPEQMKNASPAVG